MGRSVGDTLVVGACEEATMPETEVVKAARAASDLANTVESLAAAGELGHDDLSWLRIAALDRLLDLERSGALEVMLECASIE